MVMAGVAENVGKEKCKDVAVRPGPSDDLLIGSGAFPEILLHKLEKGQELDRSRGQAQDRNQEDPAGDFCNRLQCAPACASARRRVVCLLARTVFTTVAVDSSPSCQ